MKQTEIGIIPEDWEVKEFGRYVSIVRGGSPRPIQNYLTANMDGINWIKIGDVNPGDKYIISTEEKIIPEGKTYSREVHKGDFLLSNSMSFGRPYILQIDGCIHDGWLAIQNYSETFDRDFLFYLLGSEAIQKQYLSMAAGSSVQNLNKEKVAKLLLPVPPTMEEQQKIAKVLGNIDNTINALEKLIEKKKNIKQAAMQQLLTPKPDWKQTTVGYIAKINKGTQLNSDLLTDKNITMYPCLNGGIEPSGYTSQYNVKKNTISISEGGNSCGFINYNKTEFWAGGHCYYLSNISCYDIFLYFLLKNHEKQIMSLRVGSGLPNIQKNSLKEFILKIPKTITEQKKTADILSDMQNEISALEQKISKYRSLKAAMASQLLTGKIRLV